MAKKASIGNAYQLKIELKYSQPLIWRRFQVPGSMDLGTLHQTIQEVMGWEESHLHQFMIGQVTYVALEAEPDGLQEGQLDEKKSYLNEVLPAENTKFIYVYDFGDDWMHEVTVEKIWVPGEPLNYPVCTAGERACPPEDCGGVHGYECFLEAIRDENHSEHESMKEWIGGDFDPEKFPLNTINKKLKKVM